MLSPLCSRHDRRQVCGFLARILEQIRKDCRHPSIRVNLFLFDAHRRPRDNQHLMLVLMNGNVLDAPRLPATLGDPDLPLKRMALGVSGGCGGGGGGFVLSLPRFDVVLRSTAGARSCVHADAVLLSCSWNARQPSAVHYFTPETLAQSNVLLYAAGGRDAPSLMLAAWDAFILDAL
jgi:hypothetical protein